MDTATKIAHTPGPWAASFAEHSGYDCMTGAWSVRSVPQQRFVATLDLSHYGQKSCEQGFTSDEAEANARLIAAAPELLAALKESLAWSTSEYQSNPLIDQRARAAIAKAESRS